MSRKTQTKISPIHQIYTNKLFTNKISFQITGSILGMNRTQKAQDTWEKTGKKLVLHCRHPFGLTCTVNGLVNVITLKCNRTPTSVSAYYNPILQVTTQIAVWSKRLFSQKFLDWLWGLYILISSGYQRFFTWAEGLECKADHSPPSNASVEIRWSYSTTPTLVSIIGSGFTLLYLTLLYRNLHCCCTWVSEDSQFF